MLTETDAQPLAASVEFSADGKLKRPVGFRKWVGIGTPLTPDDLNDGEAAFPEFHSVSMDRESFAHDEKTGQFRDGTVLIKELTSVGAKQATSGKGFFLGEFTGLEVSINDAKQCNYDSKICELIIVNCLGECAGESG